MANDETTFIFKKSKYFWKFINRQFRLDDPTTTKDEMNDIFSALEEGDYTFVLAEQVPNDIYTCIDARTGCLVDDADGLAILDLQDVYTNLSAEVEMPYFKLHTDWIYDGDGGFTISLDSGATDIQIQLGDSQITYLQGIFLVKREASETHDLNFVMAYATIPNPINVRNFINVPFQGLVGGVGYCATRE